MKKLFVLLVLVPVLGFGQKLVKNEVDDFTKKTVKETNYEMLTFNTNIFSKIRARKIDESVFLDVMLASGTSVFSVDKDAKLMFKLTNDSVVTLNSLNYKISCAGCGTTGLTGSALQGVSLSFNIDQVQSDLIKSAPCSKMRIYTTNGYIECDIKDKHSYLLKKSLEMVL